MPNIKQLKTAYNTAKQAKIGEEISCPSCGTKCVKSNYQQAFCKTKPGTQCKDFYWNNITPSKRNNTTRISPANARYMASKPSVEIGLDIELGWDEHKYG